MHNMVIEDESLNNIESFEHGATIQMYWGSTFNSYMEFTKVLKNQKIHFSLWNDLVENL